MMGDVRHEESAAREERGDGLTVSTTYGQINKKGGEVSCEGIQTIRANGA
jgi:hypothetical protein